MPLHDWTRIDANDYHDFHGAWIYAIRTALNNGLLPEGFFALAEHTTPPIIADVVTLSIPDESPPLSHTVNANGAGAEQESTSTIVATAPGKKLKPRGRRRVAIHHARNRQIVAVIELVSPTNKASKTEFADLIGKTLQLLRQGVHVMIIDPFPPTPRDPKGIHATIWKELTGKTFTPPDGKPLTVASYVALGANTFRAFVEPLAVGDRLPDMRLHLTSEFYVLTPLEETYQTAWQGFPAPLRAVVDAR